jgi:hypothetical protein
MKRKNIIRIIFLFGIFALFQFTRAQDTDKLMKLRLAQGFEEAGEWEHAVALYEELSTLEPNNYLFLDGLQRSYMQMVDLSTWRYK